MSVAEVCRRSLSQRSLSDPCQHPTLFQIESCTYSDWYYSFLFSSVDGAFSVYDSTYSVEAESRGMYSGRASRFKPTHFAPSLLQELSLVYPPSRLSTFGRVRLRHFGVSLDWGSDPANEPNTTR